MGMLRARIAIAMLAGLCCLPATAAEPPAAAERQFAVAVAHYQRARWPLAAEEFTTFLAKWPEHPQHTPAQFFCAEALVQAGDRTAAAAGFVAYLTAQPAGPYAAQAQYRLGEAAFLAGDAAQAKTHLSAFLERVAANHPLREYALVYRGEVALRQQDPAQAEPDFNACLQDFPHGTLAVQAHLGAGRVALAHKQYDAARTHFAVAAETGTPARQAEAELRLGDTAVAQEQWSVAVPHYQRVSTLQPKSGAAALALLALVRIAARQSDTAAALASRAQFATRFTTEHRLWPALERSLARSYFTQGDYAAAETHLQFLCALGETNRQLAHDQYLLAACLRMQGQPIASAELLAAMRASTNDPQLLAAGDLQAGLAATQLEHWVTARDHLLQYLAAEPESAHAWTARLALVRGYLAEQKTAPAQAIADLGLQADWSNLYRPAQTQQLAELFFSASNYPVATQLAARVAASDSSAELQAQARLLQAWSATKRGAWEEVWQLTQPWVTAQLAQPRGDEALLLAAEAATHCQLLAESARCYRQLAHDYPASSRRIPALLSALNGYEQLKQFAEIDAVYADLLASTATPTDVALPARPELLHRRAENLRRLQKSAEADLLDRELIEHFPTSPLRDVAVYRLAESAYAAQDWDRCEALLTQIEDLPPEANLLRGLLAVTQQQWAVASTQLSKWLATQEPSAATAQAEFYLGEALARTNRTNEALERFTSLAIRPGLPDQFTQRSQLRQAQLLYGERDFAAAAEIATNLRKGSPQFAEWMEVEYLLGRCRAMQADFEAARGHYRQITKAHTNGTSEAVSRAQWMIGETYFHQGQYALALQEYRQVIARSRQPSWRAAALLQAGKCLERIGQQDEALRSYRQLLAEMPTSEWAPEAQSRIQKRN